MSEILDYEDLVAGFEHSLLTQLRGHGSQSPFLEGWVPDEDPVLSLLNMLEAAEIAGKTELCVRVSRETLPVERLDEVCAHGEEFGSVAVEGSADGWLLSFGGIGSAKALRQIGAPYRDALRSRLDLMNQLYSGNTTSAEPGARLFRVEENGFALTALVGEDGVIVEARHDGAPERVGRAVLDFFCEVLQGLPVQEAADHGGHRLLARLTAADVARPVAGIVLVENADPIFLLPRNLARALLAAWRKETNNFEQENEFSPPPQSAWANLPETARAEEVTSALAAYLREAKESEGALRLSAMEGNIRGYPVRAVVVFGQEVAAENKPELARRAESYLKRRLDPLIELYVEELQDQNEIRRL